MICLQLHQHQANTFTQQQTKNDVWYSFTPSCTAELDITTTFTSPGSPNIDFDIFPDTNCPTSGNALYTSSIMEIILTETLTQTFTAGTTYYIRVIDYNT